MRDEGCAEAPKPTRRSRAHGSSTGVSKSATSAHDGEWREARRAGIARRRAAAANRSDEGQGVYGGSSVSSPGGRGSRRADAWRGARREPRSPRPLIRLPSRGRWPERLEEGRGAAHGPKPTRRIRDRGSSLQKPFTRKAVVVDQSQAGWAGGQCPPYGKPFPARWWGGHCPPEDRRRFRFGRPVGRASPAVNSRRFRFGRPRRACPNSRRLSVSRRARSAIAVNPPRSRW